MVDSHAIIFIIVYILTIWFFTSSKNKITKYILAFLVFIISLSLMSHKIPGFHNIILYDSIKLDHNAAPYSLWLNFDKSLILLLFIYYFKKAKKAQPIFTTIYKSLGISIIAILTLLMLALQARYIEFSPKIPDILATWIALNLVTVITEEIFFRGFLQNYLQEVFNRKYIALILANTIFACVHYQGGMAYMILSFIAGLFYGVAFLITQRVTASIIVHFTVNLVHIMLFTYPSLAYTRYQ
jgi:membrane protease YdiL (CAAX protease family)